jgi:hypothetical protein
VICDAFSSPSEVKASRVMAIAPERAAPRQFSRSAADSARARTAARAGSRAAVAGVPFKFVARDERSGRARQRSGAPRPSMPL